MKNSVDSTNKDNKSEYTATEENASKITYLTFVHPYSFPHSIAAAAAAVNENWLYVINKTFKQYFFSS